MKLTRLEINKMINAVYLNLLGREVDTSGLNHWADYLESGNTLEDLKAQIVQSEEFLFKKCVYKSLASLHMSRIKLVQHYIPEGQVIIDLGGGCIGDERGALVVMGYPYPFKRLYIIEPPLQNRHQIYKNIPDITHVVTTALGLVEYRYVSMTDLHSFNDQSIDLVFSGETIEHVTVEDCKQTLKEVAQYGFQSARFIMQPAR